MEGGESKEGRREGERKEGTEWGGKGGGQRSSIRGGREGREGRGCFSLQKEVCRKIEPTHLPPETPTFSTHVTDPE